jgi:hypothetical protein
VHVLAAPFAHAIALMALAALGVSYGPVHDPVHDGSPASSLPCYGAQFPSLGIEII